MLRKTFVDNPHYVKYICLLLQLHGLIAAGKGDDDEADDVRDEMDAPWRQLTPEEISRVRGLSADLYMLGKDRDSPRRESVPASLASEVRLMYDREQWIELSMFLRDHEAELPRADVAYYRGVCWNHWGHFHVASEFYTEAANLDPRNKVFDVLRMQSLIRSQQLDRAMERAKQIVDTEADWRQLLIAGRAFFARAGTVCDTEANALYKTAIQLAERGLALAPKIEKTGGEPTDEARLSCLNAHLDRIWSYDRIGQTEQAIEACNDALRIEPENSDALILRGWLLRPTQQESASVDFHAGIGKLLSSRPESEFPVATFPSTASP